MKVNLLEMYRTNYGNVWGVWLSFHGSRMTCYAEFAAKPTHRQMRKFKKRSVATLKGGSHAKKA